MSTYYRFYTVIYDVLSAPQSRALMKGKILRIIRSGVCILFSVVDDELFRSHVGRIVDITSTLNPYSLSVDYCVRYLSPRLSQKPLKCWLRHIHGFRSLILREDL